MKKHSQKPQFPVSKFVLEPDRYPVKKTGKKSLSYENTRNSSKKVEPTRIIKNNSAPVSFTIETPPVIQFEIEEPPTIDVKIDQPPVIEFVIDEPDAKPIRRTDMNDKKSETLVTSSPKKKAVEFMNPSHGSDHAIESNIEEMKRELLKIKRQMEYKAGLSAIQDEVIETPTTTTNPRLEKIEPPQIPTTTTTNPRLHKPYHKPTKNEMVLESSSASTKAVSLQPFNFLARVGTPTGTQGRIYNAVTGALVSEITDSLDLSVPCSTGHFGALSGDTTKKITIYDSAGAVKGSVFSERNTKKVNITVTAHANDVLQWDETGFTLSFFNRDAKFPLQWETPLSETLVSVAINDQGTTIYAATYEAEDPDLAIVYKYSIVPDTQNNRERMLLLDDIAFFSVATTSTAFTPSELESNPPTGAALVRLFAFNDNTLVISDSNDDRARLVTFSVTNQSTSLSSFTGRSVRLAFTPLGTSPISYTLGGYRASTFAQQGNYLFVGDQLGNLNVWNISVSPESSNQEFDDARYPVKMISVRSSLSSTEWCIAGAVDTSSTYIVACGDESNLVIVNQLTGAQSTVTRTDGTTQSFTRILAHKDLVVATEFSGTNLIDAYQLANGSTVYKALESGLDPSLAISKISPLDLDSKGEAQRKVGAKIPIRETVIHSSSQKRANGAVVNGFYENSFYLQKTPKLRK